MRMPKTLSMIECRTCRGTMYGGSEKLILKPGTATELPDELSIIVRKVARCVSCKQREDRTAGGKRKRFER